MKILGSGRAWLVLSVATALTSSGAFAFAAVPASAAPSSWAVAPMVQPGRLAGVSCLGPNRCVAVGDTDAGRRTLSEAGNLGAWTVMRGPNPSPGSLAGVSCVTIVRCVAVGYAKTQALIEIWNGDHWAIKPSPRAGVTSQLAGVSCLSKTRCVAVGGSDTNGFGQTLAEIWNGTRWSIMRNPELPLGWAGILSGVSCASPTRCVAVGTASPPGIAAQTLIEVWNGDHWAIKPSPTHGNSNGRHLSAVSCVSLARCVAVGWVGSNSGATRTLTEAWDGTRWSVLPSPNHKGTAFSSMLSGVSCARASSCVAVGSATLSEPSGDHSRTLIEQWDGTRWSLSPSPPAAGSQDFNQLGGVSCTTGHCEAVGYYYPSHFAFRTLAISRTAPR